MRRWSEQRWLIDNIIRANGPEWDQPRLASLNAALGPESTADVATLRQRIQKLADAAPAFEAVARRREAKAQAADDAGEHVTARENYYMAANYWASAQWPIDENNALNLHYNERKRACYMRYAQLADHRIEAAWVPLDGKALPGWLHLPPGEGPFPVVVSIPGMDGFKERSVALYGDPWLSRGVAVLVVEGPGQYESAVLGIHASVPAWAATGRASFDWLAARPDIDARASPSPGAALEVSSPRSRWRTSRVSAPVRSWRPASSRAAIRSSKRLRRPTRSASCTWRAIPTRRLSTRSAKP